MSNIKFTAEVEEEVSLLDELIVFCNQNGFSFKVKKIEGNINYFNSSTNFDYDTILSTSNGMDHYLCNDKLVGTNIKKVR